MAASTIRAYLRAQVDELRRADPQVRQGTGDAVHAMRVASRRLRSALATYRPLLSPGPVDELRAELAWLSGALGAARDAEVVRDRVLAAVGSLPPDLAVGPVAARANRELDADAAVARAASVDALTSPRWPALLARLEELVADPPFEPRVRRGRSALHGLARHDLGRVVRALRAVHEEPDPARRDPLLHELRKTAKRARYAGESVIPVFDDRARAFAARMARLQELLGEHQDTVVVRSRLRVLAAHAAAAGEDTCAYAVLDALQAVGPGDPEATVAQADRIVDAARRAWPVRG